MALVLDGVAIAFACGHSYVKCLLPLSDGEREVELNCPRCASSTEAPCCLYCGSLFSGRWFDYCTSCDGFWNLEAWASYAARHRLDTIRCQHGAIVVPHVDAEEEPWTSGWPECLTMGEGDLKLSVACEGGERREIERVRVSSSMEIVDQVDIRCRPQPFRPGQELVVELCDVECELDLDPEIDWTPPQPFDGFSWVEICPNNITAPAGAS